MSLVRAYYEASFDSFLRATDEEVLGHLSLNNAFALDPYQRNAWVEELTILRLSLEGLTGHLLLEYSIPRMGRRVDVLGGGDDGGLGGLAYRESQRCRRCRIFA